MMSRNRQVCSVSRGACCYTSFRCKTAENVDRSKTILYLRLMSRHSYADVIISTYTFKAFYVTEHWLDLLISVMVYYGPVTVHLYTYQIP